ncbi:MAG TPA: prepilin-type N-terminal cleavage/methylation domain-containing protein [Mycobacteriales bacterium]|nr:prepilin-type N-terminal cleavage/methylation domain-containing protein [Mycobacteriales bacterium]
MTRLAAARRAVRASRCHPGVEHDADAGVTLVEMVVATLIFTIILAIISTAVVSMLGTTQRDNSQANDMDAARKVISLLDHQLRYANAISTPGNSSYSSGCVTGSPCYVEWRNGNVNQQQTCTQWRFTPSTGTLAWRTWQPPLSGVGSVTATGWATAAIGLSQVNSSTPLFSIVVPTVDQPVNGHYQLALAFNATSGAPAATSTSEVTITAINSTRLPASPTPPSVCTEVTRS